MRVLVISATSAIMATAVVAAAAELRDKGVQILIVDDSASRGILDAPELFLPIEAAEAYECPLLATMEDLPRPPRSLIATLPARGYVRLHNKHDYG